MTKFSANLGFLWSDLSLPDAISAARRAGFDAVECHWPYATPSDDVLIALRETGLTMLGLNTARGDVTAGENGLSALPGREADARQTIDQALQYAVAIGTPNIHVMAGFADGDAAHRTFVENLKYAANAAAPYGITILIEPLNRYDAPGYFLQTADQAAQIIDAVNATNLKLMFDCYHLQIMQGDISRRLAALMPIIGHIQFAAVPTRAEPDTGELDYRHVFQVLLDLNYDQPLGAEYKPATTVADGLGWMNALRRAS